MRITGKKRMLHKIRPLVEGDVYRLYEVVNRIEKEYAGIPD
jgi:hypothetical protein